MSSPRFPSWPVALLLIASPWWARAMDAPHDASHPEGISECKSCHVTHQAAGGTLTRTAGNANLCQSCHNTLAETTLGFPWVSDDQAVPGSQGRSHRWDAAAVNAAHGAQVPASTEMAMRLDEGKLMCSTCHDQHSGASLNGGRQHTSYKVGVAQTPFNNPASTATLKLDPPAAAATAKGYLLKVATGGATGTATFQLSNDNGKSWFGWSGAVWQAGVAAGRPTGTAIALNDGTNVKVTFAGTMAAGDQWRFYVSYPFLRVPNPDSAMCEDCHRDRVMTDASAGADGTKEFSHPVGVGPVAAHARATPLDANGAVQASAGADANATNNLSLDSTGKVRCLTCHSPHNADSNSLTEDIR